MSLTPAKALIFRIVHGDNLPWILDSDLGRRDLKIKTTVQANWYF